MSAKSIRNLGIYLLLLGLGLFYLSFVVWPPDFKTLFAPGTPETAMEKNPISPIVFWDCTHCLGNISGSSPTGEAAAGTVATPSPKGTLETETTSPDATKPCQWRLCVTYDQRLFLLVLVLGALGSYIHAATSFADFAGNRRLVQSWLWWYLLRPFTGAPTSVVLYFAVRAGFMSPSSSGGDISRFGIAALAMFGGMFSIKAADKLEEVFDVLFKTQEKRKDALENSIPVLNSITPQKVKVNSGAQQIVLAGSNFSTKAVVLVDGRERAAIDPTPTKLSVALTPEDVSTARTIKLAVKNPPPGGGISAALPLIVEA